jgi:hypothetical protein
MSELGGVSMWDRRPVLFEGKSPVPYLYRTSLIVARKQPYIDWANSLREDDETGFPEELARRRDIYLGPMSENEPSLDKVLADLWPDVFEEALYAWSTNEAQWPPDRTREMFDRWFDVELADSIIDLAPEEPLTDEDLDLADVQDAMSHCAWCGTELGDGEGRLVPFELSERERLADREGRVVSLPIRKDRSVMGVVTPKESAEAGEGGDVIFWACGRACEKRLQKEVPAALREFEERLAASQSRN